MRSSKVWGRESREGVGRGGGGAYHELPLFHLIGKCDHSNWLPSYKAVRPDASEIDFIKRVDKGRITTVKDLES